MKSFGTLKIALRSRKLRFRLRTDRPSDGPLRLEGARIDLKQEIALVNNRASLKCTLCK